MSTGGRIRIGTSGWRYASWRGAFYPDGLAQRRELEYLSRRVDSLEINGSFYSLQRPQSYRAWRDATPEEFVFGVKGGRFITHMRRLRNVHSALADFFASGVLLLGPKLGPILWQLPESLPFDAGTLEAFCAALPSTLGEARELARRHDEHVDRLHAPRTGLDRGIRHAIEARHRSFDSAEAARILERYGVALVTADSGGTWPRMDRITADLVYARLHGSPDVYASGYGRDRLRRWANRVLGWASGDAAPDGRPRSVYVYFDNDQHAHAPVDATTLADLVARRAG